MSKVFDAGLNVERFANGALAGLAGGLVFGLLLQVSGLMTDIAGLVGSTNAAVGWGIHLALSALYGVVLAMLTRPTDAGEGVIRGVVLGITLWVVGWMLVLRPALGLPVSLDQRALVALFGHILFGMTTGAALTGLVHRAPETTRERRAKA